jgi:hypothetical protein
LIDYLVAKRPPLLRERHLPAVREAIAIAYGEAERRGLSGAAGLDFFYLHERTRRWASASLAAQRGLPIAPFLTPGYIRAVFGYRASPKVDNPFHRFILRQLAPRWLEVPFAEEVESEAARAGAPTADVAPLGDHAASDSNAAGSALVVEALAEGGFWTEVLDPDRAREEWRAATDELIMLHLLPRALARAADSGHAP